MHGHMNVTMHGHVNVKKKIMLPFCSHIYIYTIYYIKHTDKPSDCTPKITEMQTIYEASLFNQGNVASTSRPETLYLS
jgi:hypothetical protein